MKKIIITLLGVAMLATMAGCNRDMIDTNHTYDRAIIQLANGDVVEVDIAKWRDYEGEQIQITAKDGTVYLTSSMRCDLIND